MDCLKTFTDPRLRTHDLDAWFSSQRKPMRIFVHLPWNQSNMSSTLSTYGKCNIEIIRQKFNKENITAFYEDFCYRKAYYPALKNILQSLVTKK